ncbi:response regulator [Sedimenticola selenatireducens]|uniref:response regulator n=1 Tax=Sedimenticola selenatireducens TaxID=191960 RepID=UPI00048DBCED|nr:response regulator [Sedimenticola selenatireducens]
MSEPFRILVIDDEASIRESLCAFLEDYDYVVDSAESAEEALEMLHQERFDLAIVDMRLPGESGDVFIVKAARLMENLRFLIHTGSVEFHLTDTLKQQGITAEHVYLKPLNDLTVLVEGVRNLLNKKK